MSYQKFCNFLFCNFTQFKPKDLCWQTSFIYYSGISLSCRKMACYCSYTSFSYISGVKYVVQLLYTYRKGSFTGLAHLKFKLDIFGPQGKISFFFFFSSFFTSTVVFALQFRSFSMCILRNWISETLSTHFLRMKIGFTCIFLFLLSIFHSVTLMVLRIRLLSLHHAESCSTSSW